MQTNKELKQKIKTLIFHLNIYYEMNKSFHKFLSKNNLTEKWLDFFITEIKKESSNNEEITLEGKGNLY